MKIVIINTYDDKGGAAIAAQRLLNALTKVNLDVKMLVDVKKSKNTKIIAYSTNFFQKALQKFLFYFEKILFIPFEKSKEDRFLFSTAHFGKDISKHPIVKDADIIHIHWINHSFLSFKNFNQLLKLNKPIVVTMHDMWYFTGGCHYADSCTRYTESCGNCIYLKSNSSKDISYKNWKVKREYNNYNINYVACSQWLENLANQSSIFQKNKAINIPNPINTSVFKPLDKQKIRKQLGLKENKQYLIYIAASLSSVRKGYQYLNDCLTLAKKENKFKDLEILLIGADKKNEISLPYPTHKLGYISNQQTIINYYNASNGFISPSLEDNLPNTIMESMACGTPCIAFDVGGIPELIDHKVNGYVSKYKDVDDLISGIEWVLTNTHLADKCVEKVTNTFSEKIIGAQFKELYKKLN